MALPLRHFYDIRCITICPSLDARIRLQHDFPSLEPSPLATLATFWEALRQDTVQKEFKVSQQSRTATTNRQTQTGSNHKSISPKVEHLARLPLPLGTALHDLERKTARYAMSDITQHSGIFLRSLSRATQDTMIQDRLHEEEAGFNVSTIRIACNAQLFM